MASINVVFAAEMPKRALSKIALSALNQDQATEHIVTEHQKLMKLALWGETYFCLNISPQICGHNIWFSFWFWCTSACLQNVLLGALPGVLSEDCRKVILESIFRFYWLQRPFHRKLQGVSLWQDLIHAYCHSGSELTTIVFRVCHFMYVCSKIGVEWKQLIRT